MKVIFLDIDGVLNCEKAFKDGYCRYVDWEGGHHMAFYPPSKVPLNKLIQETGAKIVISSTWRSSGLEFMRNVWEQEDMKGEIISITPHLYFEGVNESVPRGCEIDKWLRDKGFRHVNWSEEIQKHYVDKSGIESYVIIDDDSDMLYKQRNRFVHVEPSPRNKMGFTIDHYRKAVEMLNKKI